jgi:hypothetical protein
VTEKIECPKVKGINEREEMKRKLLNMQQQQQQQGVRWRLLLPLFVLSILINGLSALNDAKPTSHHQHHHRNNEALAAQPRDSYSSSSDGKSDGNLSSFNCLNYCHSRKKTTVLIDGGNSSRLLLLLLFR